MGCTFKGTFWCLGSYMDLFLSQAVLRGDRVGWLANAAQLLRPLSYAGCGHVAGAVGGRCSQPWWDSIWCPLPAHVYVCAEHFIFMACVVVMQWTGSWASRTSTFSTAFWMMSRRTLLCPARRRRRRAKRNCRTPCSSSRRLDLTHTWGWFWGNGMTKAMISNNKPNECEVMISVTCFLLSSPSERTADDLEIIYEELLHIKALSHLSTTVSEGCLFFIFFYGSKTCSQPLWLLSHFTVQFLCTTLNLVISFSFHLI